MMRVSVADEPDHLVHWTPYFVSQEQNLVVSRPAPESFTVGPPTLATTGHRWPGPGPTLVLLHGFGGNSLDFEALVPHLPEELNLIALDLVGHGPGPLPPPAAFAMAMCVQRLQAAIKALECPRPHCLGYSMGGRTALHLALSAPQALASLTLVGTTAGLEDSQARLDRQDWDRDMANRARVLGPVQFADAWAALPIIRTQDRIPQPFGRRLRARRREAPVEGLARSLEGMGTGTAPALWHRLPELRLPTLVTTGADDQKYRGLAARLLSALPQSTGATLDNAGHAAHLETPSAFGHVWSAWFGNITGAL